MTRPTPAVAWAASLGNAFTGAREGRIYGISTLVTGAREGRVYGISTLVTGAREGRVYGMDHHGGSVTTHFLLYCGLEIADYA